MTASDVLTYLETQGISLALCPDGHLRCTAPRGVLTLVLQGTIKTCKRALVELLTTGEDVDLPRGVSVPVTDYNRFVTWKTGTVPENAEFMLEPLPPPKYHDVPSPPETVRGMPCSKKACRPDSIDSKGQPTNTYFRRTHLCVACYGRWTKQPSAAREEPYDLFSQ